MYVLNQNRAWWIILQNISNICIKTMFTLTCFLVPVLSISLCGTCGRIYYSHCLGTTNVATNYCFVTLLDSDYLGTASKRYLHAPQKMVVIYVFKLRSILPRFRQNVHINITNIFNAGIMYFLRSTWSCFELISLQ